jgi:hypothetical protein
VSLKFLPISKIFVFPAFSDRIVFWSSPGIPVSWFLGGSFRP